MYCFIEFLTACAAISIQIPELAFEHDQIHTRLGSFRVDAIDATDYPDGSRKARRIRITSAGEFSKAYASDWFRAGSAGDSLDNIAGESESAVFPFAVCFRPDCYFALRRMSSYPPRYCLSEIIWESSKDGKANAVYEEHVQRFALAATHAAGVNLALFLRAGNREQVTMVDNGAYIELTALGSKESMPVRFRSLRVLVDREHLSRITEFDVVRELADGRLQRLRQENEYDEGFALGLIPVRLKRETGDWSAKGVWLKEPGRSEAIVSRFRHVDEHERDFRPLAFGCPDDDLIGVDAVTTTAQWPKWGLVASMVAVVAAYPVVRWYRSHRC